MAYQFATQEADYADFASGRVIYSAPGMAAFPVRLASEIFQRARSRLPAAPRLAVYDPTCGGAYHLTALGLLHATQIGAIYASDIDAQALELARRNLSLLTLAGLERRKSEIRALLNQYGKESHRAALGSVDVFRARLAQAASIETQVFPADAFQPAQIHAGLRGARIDLVLADVPYGQLSHWSAASENSTAPLPAMLDALLAAIHPQTILAIITDKAQKVAHPGYRRVDRFQIGKRRVTMLQAAE
ncbi:MAG TPA: hypothetical protein VIO36_01745 [Anaerolineaceae bacterium]